MGGVFLREPLFEFGFDRYVVRLISEIVPLKWIRFDVIEFLATVAVMDVMKLTRSNRVIDTKPVG